MVDSIVSTGGSSVRAYDSGAAEGVDQVAAIGNAGAASALYALTFSGGESATILGLTAPKNLGDVEALFAEIAAVLDETFEDARSEADLAATEAARSGLMSLAALLMDASTASAAMDTASGKIEKLEAENTTLQGQIDTLEGQKTLLKTQKAGLESDQAGYSGIMQSESAAIAERDDLIAAEQAKDEPDTDYIAELQAANATSQANYDAASVAYDEAGDGIASIDDQIASIDADIADLQADIDANDADIEKHTGDYTTAKAAYDLASGTAFAGPLLSNGTETATDLGDIDLDEIILEAIENAQLTEKQIEFRDMLTEKLIEGGMTEDAAGRVAGIGTQLAAGIAVALAGLNELVGDAALFSDKVGALPVDGGGRMMVGL